MLYIKISGRKTGDQSRLYEKLYQQGQTTMVPTYWAEIGCMQNSFVPHCFTVIRDVGSVVFGKTKERYMHRGECPPNRICAPYRALVHSAPRNGFSLKLYDTGYANECMLQGMGPIQRSWILIHNGSGASAGCIGIVSTEAYLQCKRLLKEKLPNEQTELLVFVDPRPEADHLIHLT